MDGNVMRAKSSNDLLVESFVSEQVEEAVLRGICPYISGYLRHFYIGVDMHGYAAG